MISFFRTIEEDVSKVESWVSGNVIFGPQIIATVNAAISEFESALGSSASKVLSAMTVAALSGLATGGTSGALTAAIEAGQAAVAAAGTTITLATLTTLAAHATNTALVNASKEVANGAPIASVA